MRCEKLAADACSLGRRASSHTPTMIGSVERAAALDRPHDQQGLRRVADHLSERGPRRRLGRPPHQPRRDRRHRRRQLPLARSRRTPTRTRHRPKVVNWSRAGRPRGRSVEERKEDSDSVDRAWLLQELGPAIPHGMPCAAERGRARIRGREGHHPHRATGDSHLVDHRDDRRSAWLVSDRRVRHIALSVRRCRLGA